MKILIASDIHGSAKWCREMLSAFNNEGAQRLVLLGDILYHGPRNPLPDEYNPKEVVAQLTPYANIITAVRGNCDSEVDQMVLPFNVSSDYATIFVDGHNIHLSHGHRAIPPMGKGDVYITGHTHVPLNVIEEGGYLHLNPGSTSLPKENSNRGYIVYENGTFTFKTLSGTPYDHAKL
jgi:hypothetical protein